APTLEWSTPSPPPVYNFTVIPIVASRHPLWEGRLGEQTQRSHTKAGLVLDHGKENIGTSPLDARPDVILKMPRDSYAPFILSLTVTAIFVGLVFLWWWLVILGVVASAIDIF